MKKWILILMILLTLAVFSAHAALLPGPNIGITIINQEPDPANPGEVVDLRLRVENTGSEVADNIVLEFIEKYPFTVYSGNIQQNIGSLQGKQVSDEGIIVLYKIKVDENAVQGTNYFDIRYKFEDTDSWITAKDFPLRIRTRDIVLSVESIEPEPKLISPGDDFTLSLTLRNNADSLIRDVKVKLDLSSSDIPFAPSNTAGERQVYQISSQTGKIVRFDLMALPTAEGGVYKIPVNISYTDETGTFYSRNDLISLKVSSEPDILATIDSSEIQGNVKSGKITIKIVNRGLTNLRLLSTKLEPTDDFDVTSEPEVYVGNIDSDDYETVDYTLNVKSYEKSITLPLELIYRDSTNKQHSDKLMLTLKTNSPSKAVSILKSISTVLIQLLIIVALVLGIRWFYRRRKAKRKG